MNYPWRPVSEAKEELGWLESRVNTSLLAAHRYLAQVVNHRKALRLSDEEFSTALRLTAKALRDGGDDLPGHEQARLLAKIATLQADLGEADEMRRNYTVAFERDLDDPEALVNLAVDVKRRDNVGLTVTLLRIALTENPEDPAVWRRLLEIDTDNKFVKAEDMLRILQASSGQERLRILDDALGPLPQDRDAERKRVLEQALETLQQATKQKGLRLIFEKPEEGRADDSGSSSAARLLKS